MFVETLVQKTYQITSQRGARTLTPSHMWASLGPILLNFVEQWRSQKFFLLCNLLKLTITYSGDLKSGLVWIWNGQKEVGLQMVWISNGIWSPEAKPFEIRTKWPPFCQKPFEIQTNISGFWMTIAKDQPFENWTIWNPTFNKSGFWMVRFPDPHCN